MTHPRQVIVKPVVSEKSYDAMERGVYTFIVDPGANKLEIRKSVETVFGVKVANVNTMNREGKRKRDRKRAKFGKRPDTKRAVVTLAGDDRIDLFES